jgi:hypothetical protein
MYGASSIDLKFHPCHYIVTKINYRDKWITKTRKQKFTGLSAYRFRYQTKRKSKLLLCYDSSMKIRSYFYAGLKF